MSTRAPSSRDSDAKPAGEGIERDDLPEGAGAEEREGAGESADAHAQEDEEEDAAKSAPGIRVPLAEEAALAARRAIAAGLEQAARPHDFLKGAVLGLILVIPLTALAVYLLGRLDIGDPQASYYTVIAFVAVFAGLPAMVTVGGIGRAAAAACARPAGRGGPAACTRVAAIYTALTNIGLVLLTVVPMGEVPIDVATWLWIVALGGSTGALGGFVLGLWVAYAPRSEP
jgi:hypothetical protein